MAVSNLTLAPNRCNSDAIKILRDLLTRAEAGEIITITGVAELADSTETFGSKTMSRQQTMGALMDALLCRADAP